MTIRYASVCDGISAAAVAWKPLGWDCAWVSEIDPFACAVLAERWPDHHNVGDLLAIDERIRNRGPVDVLVGGTPCQSFSVAGLLGGLDDARGNLALRFCQLAGVLRPRWIVWENVPGVLSSHGGRDFGSIVGAMEQLGYGIAYRILDAQFFGVPQRRRRVFVVGHLGDWRRSAAVLFDAESLRGNSSPRLKTGKAVAGALTRRIDRGGVNSEGTDNHLIPVVGTLSARSSGGGGLGTDFECDGGLIGTLDSGSGRRRGSGIPPEQLIASTVTAKWAKGTGGPSGDECQNRVAHTLCGEGFEASKDGSGRGTPLVPVAYRTAGDGAVYAEGDRTAPLTTNTDACANIVAYQCQGSSVGPMGTLRTGHNVTNGVPIVPLAIQGRARGDDGRGYARPEQIDVGICGTLDTVKPHAVLAGPTLAVRRLTPRECERLQGFPDDYTLVQWYECCRTRFPTTLGKYRCANCCGHKVARLKVAADAPRYKAIGNSMAVPVMRWIGERIAFVDQIPISHS